MPASASCPSRSSCRPARRSTDRCWAEPIRAAASSSSSASSSSARWRSTARLGLLAGHRPRAARLRGARPDDASRIDVAEPARRHLRPDRDGGPGHHRPARAPRRRAGPADARPPARDRRRTDPDPRARRRRVDRPARPARRRREVPHPPARARARRWRTGSGPRSPRSASFALSLEPEAGARLPAVGRRARTRRWPRTCSASSIAKATGQYGIEQAYQATLAGQSRILVAQRDGSGQALLDEATVSRTGEPGHGPAPDDRRRPAAAGRAGAAGRLGRRPGEARLGGRDGSVHRRDLRDGDLPGLRRQRLQGDRDRGSRAGSSTRWCRPSTSPGPCSR